MFCCTSQELIDSLAAHRMSEISFLLQITAENWEIFCGWWGKWEEEEMEGGLIEEALSEDVDKGV